MFCNIAKVTHTNNEGNVIGTSTGKDNARARILMSYRVDMLYFINESISYLYLCGYTSQMTIEKFEMELDGWESDYIEPSLKGLWARGLLAGLKKDYVVSSYILTPLIERALHDFAEKKTEIDITKLHKEKQDEPSLRGDLELLRPFITESLWYELSLFLNEGIGLNYRNKLCHGIISMADILTWGAYLWWIGLVVYIGAISYKNQKE